MRKLEEKSCEYTFYSIVLFIFAILMNIYCIRMFYKYYDGNEISNLSQLTLDKLYNIKDENYLFLKARMEYRNSHLKIGSFFSVLFLILSYVMDYFSNFEIKKCISLPIRIILLSMLILMTLFIGFGIIIWTSWD